VLVEVAAVALVIFTIPASVLTPEADSVVNDPVLEVVAPIGVPSMFPPPAIEVAVAALPPMFSAVAVPVRPVPAPINCPLVATLPNTDSAPVLDRDMALTQAIVPEAAPVMAVFQACVPFVWI
jgi:hypothetical protein